MGDVSPQLETSVTTRINERGIWVALLVIEVLWLARLSDLAVLRPAGR